MWSPSRSGTGGEELREGGAADMARHSGGRGWYGKVVGAALGV
ncbi:polysaccharide deacetylase family protein, partial [Streptomyces sp. SID6013]|nr:polysaccharide deacetylase family protein [Streptomyces sp. SID6013]